MMLKKHAIVAATLALAALSAQAHDMWFKPSSTVLSKSDWVTVDAAVSNDVFFQSSSPGPRERQGHRTRWRDGRDEERPQG